MLIMVKILFQLSQTQNCVPVVTLSARDNQKLSKLRSKRFERLDYWNEYKAKDEKKNTTNEQISCFTLFEWTQFSKCSSQHYACQQFNEYNNCFKIHIYYLCISRIQFSSSEYYKLKYYQETLHRCSYKIITIIKILQCSKLIKKQYNNILTTMETN